LHWHRSGAARRGWIIHYRNFTYLVDQTAAFGGCVDLAFHTKLGERVEARPISAAQHREWKIAYRVTPDERERIAAVRFKLKAHLLPRIPRL
jgi:hypothetical protein